MAIDRKARALYGAKTQGIAGMATQGSTARRPISWNGRLTQYPSSDGVKTWANSQFAHNIMVNTPGFYLRYANFSQDAVPFTTGEQSATIPGSTIVVRAAVLKLVATNTINTPTTTGCNFASYAPNFSLGGKLMVITNLATGQQSQIISSSSGNAITVPSWLGGTPTTGAACKIYDIIPVTFNGQRNLTMDPQALVDSDYVSLPCLAGEIVYVVTNVFCASGTWPAAAMPFNSTSYDMWNATGTGANVDATGPVATGAWGTTASAVAMNPIGLFANVPPGTAPSVGFVGDSIIFGTGISNDAANGYSLGTRFLVDAGLPGWTGGIPGETTYGANQPRNTRIRTGVIKDCQYVVTEWGVNDNGALSLGFAVTQANMLAYWARLASMGCKVIQRIPSPFGVTSTDGWTTTAGQTSTNAAFAAWQQVGAWLRDTSAAGAVAQSNGTLWKVFDPAPYQFNPTTGLWLPAVKLASFSVVSASGAGAVTVAGTPFTSPYQDVANNSDRYQVRLTSGLGVFTGGVTGSSGKNATINNVLTGNQLNLNSAFTTTPLAGDTFDIWGYITPDGTHIARTAAERESAGFKATIVPLMKAFV